MPTTYTAALDGRGFRFSVRSRKHNSTHSPDLATREENDMARQSGRVASESARMYGASSHLSESTSAWTGQARHVATAASALPKATASVFAQQTAVPAEPNGRDLCENRRARREMTDGDRFPKRSARGKVSWPRRSDLFTFSTCVISAERDLANAQHSEAHPKTSVERQPKRSRDNQVF